METKERKYNKYLHPEYVKGAVLAAAIAEEIQGNNGYRVEDRILLKLNIITKRQVRTIGEIENLEIEKIMKQWDFWRKRIAEGDKSDAPTVWFGSVIDTFLEQIAQRSEDGFN